LAAALASVLFFGHILYWGFCQFAFGWLVFLGFLLLLQVRFRKRMKEALAFFAMLVILYFAHIFWFLAALAWLGVTHIFIRRNLKVLFLRAVGAVPLLCLAAVWYPNLAAYGFRSQTLWFTIPFERLLPTWLSESSFGGLKGALEPVFFGLIVLWALLAWLPNRKGFRSRSDGNILILSALFFIAAFLLPDKHTNTIQFCQRWVPPGLVLLLLGLPEIKVRKSILTAFVAASLVAFFSLTTVNWMAFERSELSGLSRSLMTLPRNQRVIGLSFMKESAIVRGRPFIQVFAHAQVCRGGELNFSFADFGPSLVIYKKPRALAWTSGLEWFPERAKKSDLLAFDYALISGDDRLHAGITQEGALVPQTPSGHWRLYKPAR
jgi:hypothetical protein